MEAIFLKLLNMSITAGYLVILILLLRVIFPRIPRGVYFCLWAMAALRLVLPASIESVLSLIPSTQPVPPGILYTQTPAVTSGMAVLDQAVNPSMAQALTPAAGASVNPIQIITAVCSWIWAAGMAVMVLHALVSYLRLRRQTADAVSEEGYWSCGHTDTPFLLGAFRPKLFLPPGMEPRDRFYILAHLQAHMERKDSLWKSLGYLILTVYWFNPIIWAAYIFFCRDLELACDERVICTLGRTGRRPYSRALLHCSAPKRLISACPLAFGETGVKSRARSSLHYRKPGFWTYLIAAVLCAATAVCFLTDPKKEEGIQLKDLELEASSGFTLKNPNTGFMTEYVFEEEDPCLKLLSLVRGENPRPVEPNLEYSYILAFRDVGEGPLILSFCEDNRFSISRESGPVLYDLKGITGRKLSEALGKLESSVSPKGASQPGTDWGILLITENVTPTHGVIRFISSADTPDQTYYLEPGYSLEWETENGWVRLNADLNDSSGWSTVIDLPWYAREGNGLYLEWKELPPLAEGHYRIGVAVTAGEETRQLYGEFNISPEVSGREMIPLTALPVPYTQEEADLDGCLVISEGMVSHGMERWDAFYSHVSQGEPASLRLCKAFASGDTVPVEEIYDIQYNGDGYAVSWLSEGTLLTGEYSNLQHDMGQDPDSGYYDQWEKWYLSDYSGSFPEVQESRLPYLLIFENRHHTPEGLPYPENTVKVRLEYQGRIYAETEDPEAIEGLRQLFEAAEYCYGGIKTQSIDGSLNLIAEDALGNFVKIELDPIWDYCRVGEDYYWYGAPDEIPYIWKIWEQLDIDQWPQPIYDEIPEAFRYETPSAKIWKADCEEFISLRKEPGGEEVLAKIPKDDTFTLLERQDTYALVLYQGMEGWVHTGYIAPVN